jgi:hypothetical protein
MTELIPHDEKKDLSIKRRQLLESGPQSKVFLIYRIRDRFRSWLCG